MTRILFYIMIIEQKSWILYETTIHSMSENYTTKFTQCYSCYKQIYAFYYLSFVELNHKTRVPLITNVQAPNLLYAFDKFEKYIYAVDNHNEFIY